MKKKNTRGFLGNIFGQSNKEIKMDIISNNEYIEWLVCFTNKYPAWRNDMVQNQAINLTNNDQKNIEKLRFFFETISNYADEHGINYNNYGNEIYYLVKINNLCFQIGIIKGEELCYYCQKAISNGRTVIDFGDVPLKNKIALKDKSNEEYALNQLENLIFDLYRRKIPIEQIEKTTKRVLKKIKLK